jgi:hypothetical protein
MIEKRLRHDLKTFLKRHVKWFDDMFPNDTPHDDTLEQVFTWMSIDLRQALSKKRFKHLFKLRLAHYRELKG